VKKLIFIPALLLAIVPAVAQAPQGLTFWKASEIKGYPAKLAPKINAQKYATETLTVLEGNNVLMVHREGVGEAEYHEGAGDFTIIESGKGTLVVGGTMKDGKTTAPGEIRGPGIDKGVSYPVTAGDIINIPPKTPHQVLVPKGGQVTYLVVKYSKK
jgi:mannose-6-phosphate isomerase-like protein (cupin superfamily)